MKVDTHNHTTFSPDGSSDPELLIRTAIERGIDLLCFTEHLDNNYPQYADVSFNPLITKAYFDVIGSLRDKYNDDIEIVIGVEAGYTADNKTQNMTDLNMYPYEFVINSVHVVNGNDVYRPEFFVGLGKEQGYRLYLEAVYESLFPPYKYDVVGHLGYVSRYADFGDNRLSYADYADVLDKILCTIIEKGKVLELNSSAGNSGSLTLPDESIVRRYYELGGRAITFGSDSHATPNLGKNYDSVRDMVKAIGFTQWTIKRNGSLIGVDI